MYADDDAALKQIVLLIFNLEAVLLSALSTGKNIYSQASRTGLHLAMMGSAGGHTHVGWERDERPRHLFSSKPAV